MGLPYRRVQQLREQITDHTNPLVTAGFSPYFGRVPTAGWFGSTLRILLVALVLVATTASPAVATLYPPPIRLALLFGRVPWQPGPPVAFLTPPGHIAERWER